MQTERLSEDTTAGKIEGLEKLRDAGILSEEEFETKRKNVTRDGKT